MISESTNPKDGSAQAVNTFQIWLCLFLCMALLTVFFAFAAQTRLFSPFITNFLLIDAYTWVEYLGIVDGSDGPTSTYWSEQIAPRFTFFEAIMAIPSQRSDRLGFGLLFQVSPLSFLCVSLASLAMSCYLMVQSGATISRQCAILFGCVVAFNPLCWLWSLGPYKEPYSFLLGSLILAVIIRARIPAWCFVLSIVLSSFGLILRIELTAFLFAILIWVVIARLFMSDRLVAKLLLLLPVLVFLASIFELNRLIPSRVGYYTPQHLDLFGDYHTELMSRNHSLSERLMANQVLRPLGILYHGAAIMVHPFLRPLGLGDQGIYIFQFGRWVSHLLCALTAISSFLVLFRWRRSSDLLVLSAAVVLSLFTLTCIFPVVVTRYFYPAMIFVVPLLLGLPVLWRFRLLGGLLVVLLFGPLTLYLLGYPLAGLGGDKDFPAYRNPFLPGYQVDVDSSENSIPFVVSPQAEQDP